MKVWMARAGSKGQSENIALDNGVACIGWGEVPDLSGTQTKDDVLNLLHQSYKDTAKADSERRLANYVSQLWAFSHLIQKDDLVVLPLKTRFMIAIGICTGK